MTSDWSPDELEFIDRYLAGVATPDERVRAEELLARDPGSTRRYRVAVEAVSQQSVSRPDGREMWVRLWGRMSASVDPELRQTSRWRSAGRIVSWNGGREAQTLRPRIWAMIAIPLAVASVVLCFSIFTRHHPAAATQTYATSITERKRVQLNDGTQIVLAPQTSLVVDAGFGATGRDVYLSGQAYFDVASAAGHPFIVHTGDVTSRVLGTKFMVRRYRSDRDVLVAVQSGKVSAGRGNPVMLTSNTVARFSDSTVFLTTGADLREYMEWRDGKLFFTGASVSEVTKVLGHWYGLTFKFTDSVMQNRALFGVFDDHDSRQEMLQNLQILLNAKMTFQGDIVTLAPKYTPHVPQSRQNVREEDSAIPTEVGR